MKYFIASIMLILSTQAFSQKDESLNQVKINYQDSIVTFYYTIKNLDRVSKNKTYTWYKSEKIHNTAFGYSGYLLDGMYVSFYRNGQLKSQGNYKMGCKNGIWKSWDENGVVVSVVNQSKIKLRRKKKKVINKLELTKK